MTQALRDHAQLWVARCTDEISIFDWFSAFFEICSFQGAAADVVSSLTLLENSRAQLWQGHGEELCAGLDEDLLRTPPLIAASMRAVVQGIAEGDGDVTYDEILGALSWVIFIDSMFFGLGSKFLADSSERVTMARCRLTEMDRLTTELHPWGLVIPKATSGEYGQGIARVCHSLTHVNLEVHCEIAYRRIDEPGGTSLGKGLVFAVIAGVQDEGELEWHFIEGEPVHRYEVRLSTESEALVIARVVRALDELADRAHLVLLPELTGSPTLTAAIAQWLGDTRNAGRKWPILVLAGSQLVSDGSERFRNSADVLSGDGTRCLTQYKLNPYTFRHDHRDGLDIPGANPTFDYVENISVSPHKVAILDVSGLGRVVVTICEDNARWNPWHEVLVRAGPHICLAPIMNGSGAAWRWIKQSSIDIANEAGSDVLACNSGAVLGPGNRVPADYVAATRPRVAGTIQTYSLIDSGDSDADGRIDWWMYGQ